METMASEVVQCINHGSFGGKPQLCFRGIKERDFLFHDEDTLHNFLALSEETNEEFTCTVDKVKQIWMKLNLHGILIPTLKDAI